MYENQKLDKINKSKKNVFLSLKNFSFQSESIIFALNTFFFCGDIKTFPSSACSFLVFVASVLWKIWNLSLFCVVSYRIGK
jgi:hypothetical protein